MGTITALEAQRNQRISVFLDGVFAFSLSPQVAFEARIRQGQSLSALEIEALKDKDTFRVALDKAMKFLSYRPRSEAELKTRLRREGFSPELIMQVLAKLREQNLMDDVVFAQFWRDNRVQFRPRSRRLLEMELRRKGVSSQTIVEAVAGIDDEASAYRVAQKKAGSLKDKDRHEFATSVGGFLRRKGFDYEVIDHTVRRLWQEMTELRPGTQQ